MARITRKELKTDKFALEVEHTFSLFEEHRSQVVKYAALGVVVAVLIAAFWVYRGRQQAVQQELLTKAILAQEAGVGGVSATGGLTFPTQQAKDQTTLKLFGDIQSKYPGSAEGQISGYYMGAIYADAGRLGLAEKNFLNVAQNGDAKFASLAKMSLAQIYFSDGRDAQGEAIMFDLINHPTVFVSKAQATIFLARSLRLKKPAEARKLLDPLKTQVGVVGQEAITLLAEIPQ